MKRLDLPTAVAHAGWSEHWFHGRPIYRDLLGRATVADVTVRAVIGRDLSDSERALIDDLVACNAVADPRIWPLKVTRIASAYGSAGSAMAAAWAWQTGADVGPMVVNGAARLLRDLAADLRQDQVTVPAVSDWLRTRHAEGRLPGFGTPYRHQDERVAAIVPRVEAIGRAHLRHWRLFLAVRDAAADLDQQPNIALAMAACLLDMEVPPERHGILVWLVTYAPQLANAVEGAEQAPEVLQRLPAERIRYTGPEPRVSPRARAARPK